MSTASVYFSLTKPRVLFANVLTTVAGFLFACSNTRTFDVQLGLAVTLGTTLVIASACVLNNVFDRDIDQIMERTKGRAVAAGMVDIRAATWFSTVLGVAGIVILYLWTPLLVVTLGVIGYITYVWLYGAYSKRRSTHGTLVGSISGAITILAGYCAVADQIDPAAILLFLALFFWQFAEFFSIAIYRRSEYRAAGIPVVPVKRGVTNAIKQIYLYTLLFVISAVLLTVFGYTGITYFIIMAACGSLMIHSAWTGFSASDKNEWARRNFKLGLRALLLYSVMISIGPLLP